MKLILTLKLTLGRFFVLTVEFWRRGLGLSSDDCGTQWADNPDGQRWGH